MLKKVQCFGEEHDGAWFFEKLNLEDDSSKGEVTVYYYHRIKDNDDNGTTKWQVIKSEPDLQRLYGATIDLSSFDYVLGRCRDDAENGCQRCKKSLPPDVGDKSNDVWQQHHSIKYRVSDVSVDEVTFKTLLEYNSLLIENN